MLFQMRFSTLFTLLLSLIVPAGSASADMCFNFENFYKPFTPRHNGKVERSHRKDNEYFYASHGVYSFLDFQNSLLFTVESIITFLFDRWAGLIL